MGASGAIPETAIAGRCSVLIFAWLTQQYFGWRVLPETHLQEAFS
jgi:hypothetical protein